jgi:hypothetical protein
MKNILIISRLFIISFLTVQTGFKDEKDEKGGSHMAKESSFPIPISFSQLIVSILIIE